MALLHPFRGYRFSKEKVGDWRRVVTQPYDKISRELQLECYDRSPCNVIRVTLSDEKFADPDTDYPVAGETLERWIREGVLVQDPLPSFYAYEQEYESEGETRKRTGFFALLDLEHSAGGTFPHERTLAEPKMDRLRLMRRTECNEDTLFMLYTDERLTVNRILEERTAQQVPEMEVRDDFGVQNRLWVISDPAAVRGIQNAMVPEELFIADGHHRFETAVSYMQECGAKGWKPMAPESFDKRVITCFNSADRGITILPTHRLVRDLPAFDSSAFLKSAASYFDAETVETAPELWEGMKRGREEGHSFGFYPGDTKRFTLLRLKKGTAVDPLMLAHGEAYRHLDVSILHTLILERLLGIDEAKLVAQAHVDYAREKDACVRSVDEGKHQAAFFLNPTTVEQMMRVARMGERMPQKSTDFYPKLLTGLVFMKMRIDRRG